MITEELGLNAYLAQRLGIEETSEAFQRVYAATIRYIGSGYKSIAGYHRDLQAAVDFKQYEFTAPDLRIELSSICRFTLKMRFFVLAVCLHKDPKATIQKYAQYGLSRREAVLAWNLILKHNDQRTQIRRCAKARSKTKGGLDITMVSSNELQMRLEQTASLFGEIHRNAKRLVRKNLQWVSVSHNIPIADLTCDIMCKVLLSYYQSLPNRFSEGHQLNYLRASLTNRINNMNNYYGAEKRKRMKKVGEDKYEIIVMSDNQMWHNPEDDSSNSYEDMLGVDARVHTEQMENNLTINRLLEDSEGTKRHKLYQTVLGRDCAEFTEYLRENGMLKQTMTCATQWIMAKPAKFIRKTLAKWLEVSVDAVSGGLDTLRGSLQVA
ncbi:hypothetical protein pEaSNUABM40_00340 [Erwinia phage pEa_SNUABM_40]|uniref:Uncharacterized protein n=1 Tax=Erwinia phage pEa_SNUABM_3 TaxID=2869552 RepID=A0AAE7XJ83_9CAUD|nr:hypothetical protein MPK68_gp338 [Erwinia phage pEa_SNUABM_3]QZE56872.1 hypothetical protein pEaSNUABM20_00336 [Erwinia phage pEa_SNUABM_20]QZE58556.1 hypothetical protein pEaSNUABM40_00340 [Erwinia phage pEa_SNUABM_40]UAW53117.1 hypothetical protein pEaSNUABM23_00335 [Erwinia phage pEa_SNUABM_23]UIW11012.1 hypothetical protein pEaSNUABM23_00335 [Erwinia phage pEa_SNUABM_31]QZE56535.1 hypothetical protein pEaSNUABM3_00338 [Erwinia phage pEa_SNUABM_3]